MQASCPLDWFISYITLVTKMFDVESNYKHWSLKTKRFAEFHWSANTKQIGFLPYQIDRFKVLQK